MTAPLIIALLVGVLVLWGIFAYLKNKQKWVEPKGVFPQKWRTILHQHIPFYSALKKEQKTLFEYKVSEFLANCKITGVGTTVADLDKILVAASAVIPIFAFPKWQYLNLDEVLLYPAHFNENFETEGKNRRILGMVGTGYMNQKMILSRQSLRQGFRNESDKKNTAIHEFIHLIDKADGVIDGIPSLLLEKQYVLPWFDLIDKKIKEIHEGDSKDINPYGGTSRVEFFAVLGEYFFERPHLLNKKHPKLYVFLQEIFDQQLAK